MQELVEVDNSTDVMQALAMIGAVITRGVPTSDLLAKLQEFAKVYHHPHANEHGQTFISVKTNQATPGLVGFSAEPLPLHTDRASLPEPPNLLINVVRERGPANQGIPQLYNFQQFLDICDLEDLEQLNRSSILNSLTGDKQAILFRNEEVLKCRFRIDTPWTTDLTRDLREKLRHSMDDNTFHLTELRNNDGYVILNDMWLHGRTQIGRTGTIRVVERTLLRINPQLRSHIPSLTK